MSRVHDPMPAIAEVAGGPTIATPRPQDQAVLVFDPDLAAQLKAGREESGADRFDEVWDGVYVLMPNPNDEHQEFAFEFAIVFREVIVVAGIGRLRLGVNISDREEGWRGNFRIPDLSIFLNDNPARNLGTHWVGGPDFAVEILSEGDHAREKFPFYAGIGTREILLIDRDPWALELYRLADGALRLVGTSTFERPEILTGAVLPLSFRLLPGEPRPRIEVIHADGAQRWLV